MANAATVSGTFTVLPDEIAKTISGAMTVTPADANHKWYYKLTNVSAASTDLMAGSFIDYTGVDDDTAPIAIAGADTVAFLFIQNTHATTAVYINIAAGTAAAAAGNIYIEAGESWYARLTLTTVAAVHAITSTGTADCIVAALLDDVSV
tara:strand:+ start:53 stop:502 length:450 start_codon:yes stop_codon:yes gene_type:complete